MYLPPGNILVVLGAWRSLVARLHGVQKVARSNRVAPTITFSPKLKLENFFIGKLGTEDESCVRRWQSSRERSIWLE